MKRFGVLKFVVVIALLVLGTGVVGTASAQSCTPNGSRTNHWWGYTIYLNSCAAQSFADASGAARVLGRFGVPGRVIGQYFGMLSGSVRANDRGNGVYIDFLWTPPIVRSVRPA